MARVSADLPLARDSSERFLPWLVAFMVYLAALALTSAMLMQKVVQRWDRGLSSELTIEIPAVGPEAGTEEVAERIERVMGALRGTPGVRSSEAYGPERMAGLLEPWLGTTLADENLPLPSLIAVTIDIDAPPDMAALGRRVEGAVPGTRVDDHQQWLGGLLRLARMIQLVAGGIVALVAVSAVLAVVFVTRTGLSIHRPVIEILHLIGARDSYLAAQFQRHAMRLGLRGGIIGLILAGATILPLGLLSDRLEAVSLPVYSLSAPEWGILLVLPLVTALAARMTARLTVLGTLAKLP